MQTTFKEPWDASLKMFYAEVAVPFSNRRKAAVAHLDRVGRIRERDYWILPQGQHAPGSENEIVLTIADMDAYYAEARRLVLQNP